MRLNPYLHFDGRCEAAFTFYHAVLGGEIVSMITHEKMPGDVPEAWRSKIMHAALKTCDSIRMGGDSPTGHYVTPAGFTISISIVDETEAKRVFTALAEDGTVTIPFEKAFWARGFGMCTDTYGTSLDDQLRVTSQACPSNASSPRKQPSVPRA